MADSNQTSAEFDIRVECLRIAHDLFDLDHDIDCLDAIAFITQKLSAWVFSAPEELKKYRIECLDLAIRTFDQQLSVNEELKKDGDPVHVKTNDPVEFVLRTAKAYANYIERDSWNEKTEDA
jgi:hypothetical protein